MKAHIGMDMMDLVHTVVGTSANASDVTQAHSLLHGQEDIVLGDAGYPGVQKRDENLGRDIQWHIAMRPGKRRALGKRWLITVNGNWRITFEFGDGNAFVQDYEEYH